MKLDRQKYELARARACMGQKDRLRYESGLTYLLGEVPGFPVIPK